MLKKDLKLISFVFQIELEISETYSRLVNKAYTTLKDPLKRGFYLLELKNLSPDETFPIDEEFLTTIMEKNEELESINSESSLKIFMKANREEINKHINLISKSFHCDNWKEARTNLLKLNYFINLDSKIKGKQSDVIFSKKN